MNNTHFQYSFATAKDNNEVFQHLLNPNNWWVGIYGETIEGKSQNMHDEFLFRAGEGAHYSKQRLIELVPGKKIVWLVTESNLTFLERTDEWTGTKIFFDIETLNGRTTITFTHEGLTPQVECYGACSTGWTRYLQNLEETFQ